ncbi:hypothetical protein [Prosthecomicrobium sp. N25]|uniref:hypothetical protein n=1 Tax=Prosthecomicrobium sp. N25 TaxID=3129254 RepID=UPI003076BA50
MSGPSDHLLLAGLSLLAFWLTVEFLVWASHPRPPRRPRAPNRARNRRGVGET